MSGSLVTPLNKKDDAASTPVRWRKWREWLLALGVSAAASLAIVAIFAVRGNPSGHDFQFHAASWLEVASQWRQGIVYPRWAEWANWGFGEPRFIFYPPLSWMLGAGLGLLVGWKLVAGAFVVVAQTAAGISMFALARRVLPQRNALFAAFCYAANPYALLLVYMRSDFAEELAGVFFPLLLLTLWDLVEAKEKSTAARHAALFALVFAVIWLCNAPAGVLASYSATLLLAWVAYRARSWRPLLRGAAGIALGFGLCAFYLLPAAHEQRWVRIGEALAAGLQPSQNFLYTTINDPEHNLFNRIASTTAVGMIVLTGLAGVAARKVEAGQQKELWARLMLLAAAASVLMLSITSLLWRILPNLAFLQFPWRWMLVLAVPLAYFLAAASRGRSGWVWLALFLATSGTAEAVFVKQTWWDAEDIPTLHDAIEEGSGYEGVDEYDPLGDDRTDLPQNAPNARIIQGSGGGMPAARVHVERWAPEEKIVLVNSQKPARIELRLLVYPAWHAEVDGKPVTPQRAEDTDRMIVPVEAGASRVTVRLARTADRWFGGLLSGLSAMLGAALLVRSRKK